tara:strand:- start:6994 stop:7257 length:264 start_codon:yes stop_codon:yes gene_type:complete
MKCKSFSVNFLNDSVPLDSVINKWLEEENLTSDQVLDVQMNTNFVGVQSSKLFEEGDETVVPVQNVTVVLFYTSKKSPSKKSGKKSE